MVETSSKNEGKGFLLLLYLDIYNNRCMGREPMNKLVEADNQLGFRLLSALMREGLARIYSFLRSAWRSRWQ